MLLKVRLQNLSGKKRKKEEKGYSLFFSNKLLTVSFVFSVLNRRGRGLKQGGY